MENIDEKLLNELGVYELRELARRVGVHSPTTKKRGELCDEILRLVSGQQVPEIKIKKQGRPPKSIKTLPELNYSAIPADVMIFKPKQNLNQFSPELKFSQQIQFGQDSFNKFGFLRKANESYYFIAENNGIIFSNEVVFVPSELVKEYSLIKGDLIEGKTNKANGQENYFILTSIDKINNDVPSNTNEVIDTTSAIMLSEYENIMGHSLNCGGRYCCDYEDFKSSVYSFIDFCDKTRNNEEINVALALDLSPELICFFKSRDNVTSFLTSYTGEIEDAFYAADNCINYVDAMLKRGKKINIIIFDIERILTSLNLYYSMQSKEDALKINVETVQMAKKLCGLGKAISEDCYATLLTLVNKHNDMNLIFAQEVEKICTKI